MQLNGHAIIDGNGQDRHGGRGDVLRVEVSGDAEKATPVIDTDTPTFEAAYTLTAPATWVAFESQTYTVTLVNRGTRGWPMAGSNPVQLGVHFGDASDYPNDGWTADDRFDLADDVLAGASRTFTIEVRAPATPGAYVLRHRVVQEGRAWCDDIARVGVVVGPSRILIDQAIQLGAFIGVSEALTRQTEALQPILARAEMRRRELEVVVRRDLDQLKPAVVPPASEAEVPKDTQAEYRQLVRDVREIVCTTVPTGARVLVVSKGDDALLDLDGRPASHFMSDDNGDYAGHHPADSAEAIGHLERLRAAGGEYLVIPGTYAWWLEHYVGFRLHLQERYQRAWGDPRAMVFALTPRASLSSVAPVQFKARSNLAARLSRVWRGARARPPGSSNEQ
jgi:hypothetical protein